MKYPLIIEIVFINISDLSMKVAFNSNFNGFLLQSVGFDLRCDFWASCVLLQFCRKTLVYCKIIIVSRRNII